jgi:hypothetical protein
MMPVLARGMLSLAALFAGLIALLCALPADQAAAAFFDCAPYPCWHGITPGVTLEAEALAILRRDPLIEGITTEDSSGFDRWYSWWWSDDYPAPSQFLDGWKSGVYIDTKYGSGEIVTRVDLTTTLRMGDMWAAFVVPDEYGFLYLRAASGFSVAFNVGYDRLTAMTRYTACPISFGQLLQQPVSVSLHSRSTPLQNAPPEQTPFNLRRDIREANRRLCAT